MAVPLEKRCFYWRCRATGLYKFALWGGPRGGQMREWLACLEHRDLVEGVFGGLAAGGRVAFNLDTQEKSTVIAELAGIARHDDRVVLSALGAAVHEDPKE